MKEIKLEGGTYEVIRKRLSQHSNELLESLNTLNTSRKEVFGSIDTELVGTERITTQNNCVPWDMFPIGQYFLFGYNVHLGLKKETNLEDVFSIYRYEDHVFHPISLDLIDNRSFLDDFNKLYKYYKHTQFVKFAKMGPYLHMVFRTGKDVGDIKTFKWSIDGEKLTYVDNRSDHEFKYPDQHEFAWVRTTRDHHVSGRHPHISIEDKVFVETVGGDLTIKVENNTEDGKGIYSEDVVHKDQTLDDGEIYYTIIGNVILLKIRPYQEEFRYFVYNSKVQDVRRIDALAETCILLPDDHGIIFSNGYYLQTGIFKKFENDLTDMVFEKKVPSPNGEDFLFVFYNRLHGIYLLLPYNLISQSVENPIICHGYSIFENGEMCVFRADEEPKKHHVVQIWKTAFVGPDFQVDTSNGSFLSKVGNKDVVRAMAECHEIITLINKDDSYENLYIDLIKSSTDVLDTYHWLGHEEAYQLSEHLENIKSTSNAAVDEFEKVVKIRENTSSQYDLITGQADDLIKNIKKSHAKSIDDFVQNLAELRKITGELISLEKLRYVDVEAVKGYQESIDKFSEQVSRDCTLFLLKKESLLPYEQKAAEFEKKVEEVKKVVDANALNEQIDSSADGLKMLIEIVSNLKIEDATQTTKIIDSISAIYTTFNQIKAGLKNKKQELAKLEGKAEFNAQLKLIDQGVVNYLDVSDSPEACEEYSTKLLVQIEELEGKFSEFDEYITLLVAKREEIYEAFESKKLQLVDARNKRANTLEQAADRILKAAQSRVSRFESVTEINGYFAADAMIAKVRDIVSELMEMGDTIKSEDIQSRLKSINEEAIRQLKDKSELFADGKNLINFGKFQFTVNTQPMDLSIVRKGDRMFYHLSGTNFYEEIIDEQFLSTKEVWDQEYVSENKRVYRSEYLAYNLYQRLLEEDTDDENITSIKDFVEASEEEMAAFVGKHAAQKFNEGYVKGVHDEDAILILKQITQLHITLGLTRFHASVRALAKFWWYQLDQSEKEKFSHQLNGAGAILKVFPNTNQFKGLISDIEQHMLGVNWDSNAFMEVSRTAAAEYLFNQKTSAVSSATSSTEEAFVVSEDAAELYEAFNKELTKKRASKSFKDSISKLKDTPGLAYRMVVNWLQAFVSSEQGSQSESIEETALLLLFNDFSKKNIVSAAHQQQVVGMKGSHAVLEEGNYQLHFHQYLQRLESFVSEDATAFADYTRLKKSLASDFAEDLRLNEFKPRVLSSFVRNKLIDEVYLPLIGANLAKQIGAAGEGKRTDLMGLLLLISPPGYGKTTLMEYIANRLGLVFMKINGPALGHQVVAIDPAEAPNAASREELQKLNLAFEMGDNVMIYLDDIQHCNPEFLQKFISLCDAQRKIEGVYKGKTKTYDFRGKKVCVVMAGNPYTESGEKFRIPDMLSNRADIYNLGDMIRESEVAFKMSYIENALTSNTITARLANKSHKDVHILVRAAESGNREGMDLEANHSVAEIEEYINILTKLIRVRDVILRVNQEYIYSAGQSDEYRVEPSFKLQGSYRDMNKICEKVMPIMNEEEVKDLIMSHYIGESQTLTTGAEANILKFKHMMSWQTDEDKLRWEEILEVFQKKQKSLGYGENNQFGLAIEQMESIADSLDGIKEEIVATGKIKQKYKLLQVKDKDNDY